LFLGLYPYLTENVAVPFRKHMTFNCSYGNPVEMAVTPFSRGPETDAQHFKIRSLPDELLLSEAQRRGGGGGERAESEN